MGRLSARTAASGALAALAWASGCGGAGALDPRQQSLVDTVEQFHRLARSDAEAALTRYQTPACARRLEIARDGLEGHWLEVFRPTVWEVSFVARYDAVTAFYNPWSDIAFLALWQPQGEETFAMTDAELVPGDCIRKRGVAPFKLLRHWRQIDEPPPVAVCEAACRTLEAFRQAFATAPPAPAQWRRRLPGLQDDKVRGAALLGAGMMLSRTVDEVRAYRSEAKLAGVRAAVDAALVDLRAGRIEQVLARTGQNDPATREELGRDLAGKWAGMRVVSVLDWEEWTFVFLDAADQPGLFVSLFFEKADGRPALKRIDPMDIALYEAYKRG